MDINTRELIMLALMACFGLALAWAHEDGLFAPVFAAEAAFAFVGAAYRLW
jgi:hypothetical protein